MEYPNIKVKYKFTIKYFADKLKNTNNISLDNFENNIKTLKVNDNFKAKMDLKFIDRDAIYSIVNNEIYTKNDKNKDYFRSLINMASSNGEKAGFYDGDNYKTFNNAIVTYILNTSFNIPLDEKEFISCSYIKLLIELIGEENLFDSYWNNDIDSLVNCKKDYQIDANVFYSLIYNIENCINLLSKNDSESNMLLIKFNKQLRDNLIRIDKKLDINNVTMIENLFYIILNNLEYNLNKRLK